jgi:localization factor PodJL
MGTIASQENSESGTPSEESGMRAAILVAARGVAGREGVVEMTLTAVATEAKVSAGDIYAFFTSKNDLLQAVVADDLANLAKTMRRTLEGRGDEDGVSVATANGVAISLHPIVGQAAEALTMQPPHAGENSQSRQDQGAQMQAAETLRSDAQDACETTAAGPVQESRRFPVVQPRRERAPQSEGNTAAAEANAATAEAVACLQEAVTKLESRPVDQWLERRLREFERSLEILQHNRASTDASVEHSFHIMRSTVEAFDTRHTRAAGQAAQVVGDRIDDLEKRLREMLSDIEAQSVHLARRITALENLAFASRPEMAPPPIELPPVVEVAPEPSTELQQSSETIDATASDEGEPLPSYLTAARRSAQAAEAQAGEDNTLKLAPKKPKKMWLYGALGSLAVLAMLLAGLGFVLRDASMNATSPSLATKPAPVVAHGVIAKPLPRLVQKTAVQKPMASNLARLAAMGNPSAELVVGLEYLDGKGVPKNEAAAVDWLSRAAAKGQPVAQYDLGALYADGRGVHADAVQAFQWFGAAALHGNRRAMHFLAIAYAAGTGTAKNMPEASRWFEHAAMLGAVNSQFNLAVLYERGMGVQQSLPTAYKWYAIAAAQGDHEAEARVTALASTLNPADLAAAKSAAESFKPEALDAAAYFPPKLAL